MRTEIAMRKSSIPVAFDEKMGVNLHMYDRVRRSPGQNAWNYDPDAQIEGTYLGWKRNGAQIIIKIDVFDMGGLLRFTPPIENVWRIWDVRDDEIAALREKHGTL